MSPRFLFLLLGCLLVLSQARAQLGGGTPPPNTAHIEIPSVNLVAIDLGKDVIPEDQDVGQMALGDDGKVAFEWWVWGDGNKTKMAKWESGQVTGPVVVPAYEDGDIQQTWNIMGINSSGKAAGSHSGLITWNYGSEHANRAPVDDGYMDLPMVALENSVIIGSRGTAGDDTEGVTKYQNGQFTVIYTGSLWLVNWSRSGIIVAQVWDKPYTRVILDLNGGELATINGGSEGWIPAINDSQHFVLADGSQGKFVYYVGDQSKGKLEELFPEVFRAQYRYTDNSTVFSLANSGKLLLSMENHENFGTEDNPDYQWVRRLFLSDLVPNDPDGKRDLKTAKLPDDWDIPDTTDKPVMMDTDSSVIMNNAGGLILARALKTKNPDGSPIPQDQRKKRPVLLLPFEISYKKAANKSHAPKFEKTDPYDPSVTQPLPIADKEKPYETKNSLVIHHKDVRKPNGEPDEILDFDVNMNFGAGSLVTLQWTKVDGPESGTLENPTSTEAIYRNPKKGGLYKFDLTTFGKTTRGQVWLPLAGPEIKAWFLSELQWLRQFAQNYRQNMPMSRRVPLLGHYTRATDFGLMAAAADWIGRFTSENSPNGGPDFTGDRERHTIAGIVVERHKLSNLLTAFLAREITTLPRWFIIDQFDGFGTPDGPEEVASYNAGFDLQEVQTLGDQAVKDIIKQYGFEMQEPGSWAQREWPSEEVPTGGEIIRPTSVTGFSF